MSHVQTQLMSRITFLLTGFDTTGNRVYQASEHPLTPATLPGLTIALGDERNVGGTMNSTIKQVDLLIGVYVSGDDFTVSAQAMVEIEEALYGDYANGRYFNGLALSVVYQGCSNNYVATTAVRHTKKVVRYTIEYQTADGHADTAC